MVVKTGILDHVVLTVRNIQYINPQKFNSISKFNWICLANDFFLYMFISFFKFYLLLLIYFCTYFDLQSVRKDILEQTVHESVPQIVNLTYVDTQTDRVLPVLHDGRVIIAPLVLLSQTINRLQIRVEGFTKSVKTINSFVTNQLTVPDVKNITYTIVIQFCYLCIKFNLSNGFYHIISIYFKVRKVAHMLTLRLDLTQKCNSFSKNQTKTI